MAETFTFPIEAMSRHVPWVATFSFLGVDHTGSTYLMHVRTAKDSTGTPLINASSGVVLAYAGSATVADHIAAERLTARVLIMRNPDTGENYTVDDVTDLSQVSITVTKAQLETVPEPQELGDDVTLWYDVVRTPSAGLSELILRGPFIVDAAVTIP